MRSSACRQLSSEKRVLTNSEAFIDIFSKRAGSSRRDEAARARSPSPSRRSNTTSDFAAALALVPEAEASHQGGRIGETNDA